MTITLQNFNIYKLNYNKTQIIIYLYNIMTSKVI